MPYHKIPRGRLHEDISSIEREQEIVVTVQVNVDPGFYDVFTRYVGDRHVVDVPLITRGGVA